MRDSFLLYTDYMQHIALMSMEQRGVFLTSLMAYAMEAELPEMDGMVQMAFSFARAQMDRDQEKYQRTVEARREAGQMGGRPRSGVAFDAEEKAKKANGFSEKQTKAKKANGFSEKQTKAKKPDNDTDNDNDTVTDTDTVSVTVSDPEKEIKASCPEPEGSAPVRQQVCSSFLLKDGTFFDVTEEDVAHYETLYPAIDCRQELRNIKGWCETHEAQRKTRKGARKFINSWLTRAQSQARPAAGRAPRAPNSFHDFIRDGTDYDQVVQALGG